MAKVPEARVEVGELKQVERRKDEPPKPLFVKPYEPENLHLSRDEYVKRQQEKAEIRAKEEAYKKQLEAEARSKGAPIPETPLEQPASPDAPKAEKKKGRPKKID